MGTNPTNGLYRPRPPSAAPVHTYCSSSDIGWTVTVQGPPEPVGSAAATERSTHPNEAVLAYPDASPAEGWSMAPLPTLQSHIGGTYGPVEIWPNRSQWDRQGDISALRLGIGRKCGSHATLIARQTIGVLPRSTPG
jgi:hypothetical protein